jgi:hypothetical protein
MLADTVPWPGAPAVMRHGYEFPLKLVQELAVSAVATLEGSTAQLVKPTFPRLTPSGQPPPAVPKALLPLQAIAV